MPCLALPCVLCLVQLPLAGQSQQRNRLVDAAKSVTRPHKEIIHFKQADKQWNCLNSYDDNDCSLSALFFFSFSVSALVGCVDLAAPDKRRKLANASAVLTLLLLFCFCFYFRLFVFFLLYILRLC